MANLPLISSLGVWILLLTSLHEVRCDRKSPSTHQHGSSEGIRNLQSQADLRHRELLEALTVNRRSIETAVINAVETIGTDLSSRLSRLESSIGVALSEMKGTSPKALTQTDAEVKLDQIQSRLEVDSTSTCTEIASNLGTTLSKLNSLVNGTQSNLETEAELFGSVLKKLSSVELLLNDTFSHLGSGTQVSASGNRCPEGWAYFGGSCYFFSLTWSNWQEGREECLRMDSDYVKITTMEEWNFIANNIKGHSWIGLNDKDEEGTFKWVSDNSLYVDKDKTWWHGSQPDNSEGKEDCVHYWFFFDLILWNDAECDERIGFVCEKDASH